MNVGNNGITNATAAERIAAAGALDQATRTLSRLRFVRGASKKTRQRIARAAVVAASAAALVGAAPGPTSAAEPHFVPPSFSLALGGFSLRNTPTFTDIDGDGDLDAFIGENIGNTVFFENTGTASAAAFAPSSANPFALADVGDRSSPTFADIDGDGDLDAFIGEKFGNTVFFENTGTTSAAAFAPSSANPFALADVGFNSSPTFADIDGDGDLDAFIGEFYGNTVFFENTGTASTAAFAPSSANPFALADVSFWSSPTFADIDGDGDLDAFIGEEFGNTVFFENTGTTSAAAFAPSSANPFALADVRFNSSPTFADIDGDGDLDAFIGELYGNTVFFDNTGTPSAAAFAPSSANPFALADVGDRSSPTFADIDGDGDLDAFIGAIPGNTVFFENTGSASSPAFAPSSANPFSLSGVGNRSSPTFADIDGDGDLDAFIGEYDGNTVFFENTGTTSAAAFAPSSANPFALADIGFYSRPTFADIDGDGDLDAFIGEPYGNTVFFDNTGTPSAAAFAPSSANPFALADVSFNISPTFADIDGDGDLDAFIGEELGRIVFFENQPLLLCGDGIREGGESCDDGNVTSGDGCASDCTCEIGGAPDADLDCVPDGVDNCAAAFNPDQVDSDNDGTGDLCDPCPVFSDNTKCDPNTSVVGVVGPGGGVISSPDGSVTMSIPAGALDKDTSISLTENGPKKSLFILAPNAVESFTARPLFQKFKKPVTITYKWKDRDGDDIVDRGTCQGGGDHGESCDHHADCLANSCAPQSNVQESKLVLKRDGNRFSKLGFGGGAAPFECSAHQSGSCSAASPNPTCNELPGKGTATVANCCDQTNNTWQFKTCNFSELYIGTTAGDLIPGRGSPKTDCIAEWSVHNPFNDPIADKKSYPNFKQTCTDGDGSCDSDGTADGVCRFSVSMCLNVEDNRLTDKNGAEVCTPTDIDIWRLKKPKPTSNKPHEAANALALRQAMEDLATSSVGGKHSEEVTYGTSVDELGLCSAVVSVEVPLKVSGSGKKKKGKATLKMQAETSPPAGKPKGTRDTDKVKLTCLPNEEAVFVDDCPAATPILEVPYAVIQDASAMTTDFFDPELSCGALPPMAQQSGSAWYRFVAPGTGTIEITTDGSNYDTVLALHTGSCDDLSEAACDDDGGMGIQSTISAPVVAGVVYYVEVTAYGDQSLGTLHLNLVFSP